MGERGAVGGVSVLAFLLPAVPVAKEVPLGFGNVPETQPHCRVSAKSCTQN